MKTDNESIQIIFSSTTSWPTFCGSSAIVIYNGFEFYKITESFLEISKSTDWASQRFILQQCLNDNPCKFIAKIMKKKKSTK